MDVDAAEPRQPEDLRRQDAAVRDDGDRVGPRRLEPVRATRRCPDALRLLDGDSARRRQHRRPRTGAASACRPTGRSGCVTTSGTARPASSSAASDGTANSGVPKKTTRRGDVMWGVVDRERFSRGLVRRRRRRRPGRMPELPEPARRGGAEAGEDEQPDRVDDAEDRPHARPRVGVAEEEDREEEQEGVEGDDDRAPVLVLLVPGRIEESEPARQAVDAVSQKRRGHESQHEQPHGAAHRGCRSTSAK